MLKETEIRQTKIQQKNATLENQIIAAQTTADARLTSGGASLRVRLFFWTSFFWTSPHTSQSLTKINIKPTSLTHNPKLH